MGIRLLIFPLFVALMACGASTIQEIPSGEFSEDDGGLEESSRNVSLDQEDGMYPDVPPEEDDMYPGVPLEEDAPATPRDASNPTGNAVNGSTHTPFDTDVDDSTGVPDDRQVSEACMNDCAKLEQRERCPGEDDFTSETCERLCGGRERGPCTGELTAMYRCMAADPTVIGCDRSGDAQLRCGVCDDAFAAAAQCGLELSCFWPTE